MSHAYEALVSRLQQLDKWISETERVAERTTDYDTRQHIANDLARWRDSRRECMASLARVKRIEWLNRAAAAAVAILVVNFVVVVGVEYFHRAQRGFASVMLGIAYLTLLASFVSYLIDWGARFGCPWWRTLAIQFGRRIETDDGNRVGIGNSGMVHAAIGSKSFATNLARILLSSLPLLALKQGLFGGEC